jgi:TatD DNase family protein
MWIDTHAHLDRFDLVDDRALDAALDEIEQHRILTISNSMDLPSYKRNLEIGERCDLVIPTFGVHPWNAPEYADRLLDLSAAIEQSPMIGEIGLDYHFVQDTDAYPAQRKVFEFFLSAARDQDKIVSVHTKGAEEDVLALLDRYQVPRVIVHWYSGPLDILGEMIDRGATFTVGRAIPQERLLTETDNPGGPMGFIGEPGMPVLVKDVVRGIAEAKKTTAEAIVQAVQANLLALIRDDPWLPDRYVNLLEEERSGG